MSNKPEKTKRMHANDVHMDGDGSSFDYSKTTRRATRDRKLLVIPACLLLLAMDLAVFIYLAASGYEAGVCIFPALLAVADLVLFFVSTRVSYQFRYAKWHLFFYALTVFVCVLLTLILWAWSNALVMSTLAVWVLILVHGSLCVSLLLTVRMARKRGTRSAVVGSVMLGAMLVISLIGVIFCYTRGFFGQVSGKPFENKTIIYKLDKASDSYIASAFLPNKGTRVTIPAKFEGKPVSGIDTALLENASLKEMLIESADTAFLYTGASHDSHNPDLTILANKSFFDKTRRELLSIARAEKKPDLFLLVNCFSPTGLAENEKYVVFDYDFDSLSETVLNTCVLDAKPFRGTTVALGDLTAVGDCFANYDPAATESSLLCYSEFGGGYYVKSLKRSNGADLLNTPLTSPVTHVDVTFDRVLHVAFENGNDTVADLDDYIRTTTAYSNLNIPYDRYTLSASALLGEMKERFGFTYRWRVTVWEDGVSTYSNVLTRDDAAAYLDNVRATTTTGKLDATLSPVWDLKLPTVTVSANPITYGETLQFTVATNNTEKDCLPLHYRLMRGETAIGAQQTENPAFAVAGLVPLDSGDTYQIHVAVSDPDISSLTATVASEPFRITVNKRPLTHFVWETPHGTIYDGNYHATTVTHDDGAEPLVGDDVLTYTHSEASVMHAGSYTSEITLTGSAAEKYQTTAAKSFDILKRPATVTTWSSTTLTYNALPQSPLVSTLDNVVEGDEVLNTIIYRDMGTNAGSHTVKATLPDTSDYIFETEQSVPYTILQKELIVSTWGNSVRTYNGTIFCPTVTLLAGLAEDEKADIYAELSYSGGETNVGEHTASVTLPTTSNYRFETTYTQDYTILAKPITSLTWNTDTLTYNGQSQHPVVATMADVLEKDHAALLNALTYTADAKNASSTYYSVSVALPSGSNYVLSTTSSYYFSITPRPVSVGAWSDTNYVYDGTYHAPEVQFLNDVIEADAADLIASLQYTLTAETDLGAQKGIKAYGAYRMTVTIPAGSNYCFPSTTYLNYAIEKRPLTVGSWEEPSYTYDGNTHRPSILTLTGVASVDSESAVLSTVVYSTAPKNAGDYVATARMPADSNYTFTDSPSKSFKIEKRVISVSSWSSTSLTYNGSIQNPTVTGLNNLVEGDEATMLSVTAFSYNGSGRDAGDYTISVILTSLGSTNYTFNNITQEQDFRIDKKPVTVSTWSTANLVYNGSTQTPKVTGIDGVVNGELSTLLTKLIYSTGMKDVGEDYTVTATLQTDTNYVLTAAATHTYAITPKPLSVGSWSSGTYTYNGTLQHPTVSTLSGVVVGESADSLISGITHHISASGGVNAGSHTVTAVLDPSVTNYTLTGASKTYSIGKCLTSVTWNATLFTYNGEIQTPKVVSLPGILPGEDADAILAGITYSGDTSARNAGASYTIRATLPAGNYAISTGGTCTFSISKVLIQVGEWSATTDLVYNGKPQNPPIIRLNGILSGETDDILGQIEYENAGTNAGTHTVTAKLPQNANYAFDKNITYTYTIRPATLTIVSWSSGVLTYTGEAIAPVVTDISGAIEGEKSRVLSNITYQNKGTNVGTHTVRAIAPANYTFAGTATKDYNISAKSYALSWTTASGIPRVQISSALNEQVAISYRYYKSGSSIPYTTAPTSPGNYRIEAVITYRTEYHNLSFTNTTKDFTID